MKEIINQYSQFQYQSIPFQSILSNIESLQQEQQYDFKNNIFIKKLGKDIKDLNIFSSNLQSPFQQKLERIHLKLYPHKLVCINARGIFQLSLKSQLIFQQVSSFSLKKNKKNGPNDQKQNEKQIEYFGFQLSYSNNIYQQFYSSNVNKIQTWLFHLKFFTIQIDFTSKFKENNKKKLGQGASGIVVEIIEKSTHESFACKKIEKNFLKKQTQLIECVKNEINSLRSLINVNGVIQIYSTYECSNYIYIVTELLSQQNLRQQLKIVKQFNEREAFILIFQIFNAINQIHSEQIIHRDLKLDNIVFSNKDIQDLKIKVIDFHLSTFIKNNELLTQICGTPGYMAPELFNSKRGYNEKIDSYSIGIILYTLIEGRPPFQGKDKKQLLEQCKKGKIQFKKLVWERVSNNLIRLIVNLTNPSEHDRYSMQEALQSTWMQNFYKHFQNSNDPRFQYIKEQIKLFQNEMSTYSYQSQQYQKSQSQILQQNNLNFLTPKANSNSLSTPRHSIIASPLFQKKQLIQKNLTYQKNQSPPLYKRDNCNYEFDYFDESEINTLQQNIKTFMKYNEDYQNKNLLNKSLANLGVGTTLKAATNDIIKQFQQKSIDLQQRIEKISQEQKEKEQKIISNKQKKEIHFQLKKYCSNDAPLNVQNSFKQLCYTQNQIDSEILFQKSEQQHFDQEKSFDSNNDQIMSIFHNSNYQSSQISDSECVSLSKLSIFSSPMLKKEFKANSNINSNEKQQSSLQNLSFSNVLKKYQIGSKPNFKLKMTGLKRQTSKSFVSQEQKSFQ